MALQARSEATRQKNLDATMICSARSGTAAGRGEID